MSKENKDWYKSWFDTTYYHTLYKDRDYEEAQVLIDNLTSLWKRKTFYIFKFFRL